MTEYQIAQRTEQATLYAHAGKIATALGPEWSVRPPRNPGEFDHYAEIMRATDGASFTLTGANWNEKDKYSARANAPTDHNGHDLRTYHGEPSLPSIKFARSKSPTVAAADIRRRLLAEYEPVWALLCARRDEGNAYRQRINILATEAARMIGAPVEQTREGLTAVRIPYRDEGITAIDIRRANVRPDDTGSEIEITVRGNLDTVRAIVAALKGGN